MVHGGIAPGNEMTMAGDHGTGNGVSLSTGWKLKGPISLLENVRSICRDLIGMSELL